MPSRVYRFEDDGKARKPFIAVSALIQQEKKDPRPSKYIMDELSNIAERGILHAIQKKEEATRLRGHNQSNGYPGNDLFNQETAYAYAVYYNKQLRRVGFYDSSLGFTRSNSEKSATRGLALVAWSTDPDKKRGVVGIEAAQEAIYNYTPTTTGYSLLMVNAMWYSAIHERMGLNVISKEVKKAFGEVQMLLAGKNVNAYIRTVNTRNNR